MASSLAGKVAIVTGGATGIGRAIVGRLAQGGAAVVIACRNAERGSTVAEALSKGGCRVNFVRTDVRSEADIQSLIKRATTLHGGIDYFVNNAGIEGVLGPIDKNTEADVDDVLATNVKGVFLCLKHALPRIVERGGGTVVNIASFVGTTVPLPNSALYGASKAAVLSMTRAVAAGLAATQVRLYAVCPWITDTPMIDRLTGFNVEAKAEFGKLNPNSRVASPDDVAQVVVSLLSGEFSLENGEAVLVDSGGATQKINPMSAA